MGMYLLLVINNYNYRILARTEGRHHLEDLGLEGTMILRRILKKWDAEAWSGLIWRRIRAGVRSL